METKKITNYSYEINEENGNLKIYTEVGGTEFIIAELNDCSNVEDVCSLIEDVLADLGYELVEAK